MYIYFFSVGLESLSRGATESVFIDFAQNCCDTVMRNVEKCGFNGKGKAIKCDALVALRDPASVGIEVSVHFLTVISLVLLTFFLQINFM